MRHTTYSLQNVHAIATKPHTHHRQVNLASDLGLNQSHEPHDLHPAKYTRNRIKATHTCHRQVNLLSDRSST